MKSGELYKIVRDKNTNLLLSLYKNCDCIDKRTEQDIHIRNKKSIYVMYIDSCSQCFEQKFLYEGNIYYIVNDAFGSYQILEADKS